MIAFLVWNTSANELRQAQRRRKKEQRQEEERLEEEVFEEERQEEKEEEPLSLQAHLSMREYIIASWPLAVWTISSKAAAHPPELQVHPAPRWTVMTLTTVPPSSAWASEIS